MPEHPPCHRRFQEPQAEKSNQIFWMSYSQLPHTPDMVQSSLSHVPHPAHISASPAHSQHHQLCDGSPSPHKAHPQMCQVGYTWHPATTGLLGHAFSQRATHHNPWQTLKGHVHFANTPCNSNKLPTTIYFRSNASLLLSLHQSLSLQALNG